MIEIFSLLSQISREVTREVVQITGLPEMLVVSVVLLAQGLAAMLAVVCVPIMTFRVGVLILLATVGEERTKDIGGFLVFLIMLGYGALVLWVWFGQLTTYTNCNETPDAYACTGRR